MFTSMFNMERKIFQHSREQWLYFQELIHSIPQKKKKPFFHSMIVNSTRFRSGTKQRNSTLVVFLTTTNTRKALCPHHELLNFFFFLLDSYSQRLFIISWEQAWNKENWGEAPLTPNSAVKVIIKATEKNTVCYAKE